MSKHPDKTYRLLLGVAVTAVVLLASGASFASEPSKPAENTSRIIVQGESAEAVEELVDEVGGTVTHKLSIIRAVGAELTEEQQAKLAEARDCAMAMRRWRMENRD